MRTASLTIIAATLLATPALPAQAAQNQTIPFEITDTGHMVIKLALNDQIETDAVLDTGATFPVIHYRTASNAMIARPVDGRIVNILGLGGMETFPIVDIQKAALGELVMTDFEAAYNARFADPGSGNIFPASSLPHRVLDFDFERRELHAYDTDPQRVWKSAVSRLPIERIHGLPFIKVELFGVEALALIDTGASVSIINGAFADSIGDARKSFRTVEITSATGSVESLRILNTRNFRIGNFRMKHFEVFVIEPALLETLDMQDRPVMILGLDILQRFRIQIDREKEEMLIHRPLGGVQVGPMSPRDRLGGR